MEWMAGEDASVARMSADLMAPASLEEIASPEEFSACLPEAETVYEGVPYRDEDQDGRTDEPRSVITRGHPDFDGVFGLRVKLQGLRGQARGTAFAIGPRILLTAGHVLGAPARRDAWNLQLFRFDQTYDEPLLGRVRLVEFVMPKAPGRAGHDLAIIRFQGTATFGQSMGLSSRLMRVGARIRISGYPSIWRGRNNHKTPVTGEGTVLDVRDGRIFHDAPITEGQSGAPIIDTESNEVVGIQTHGFNGSKHPTLRSVNAGVEIGAGEGKWLNWISRHSSAAA